MANPMVDDSREQYQCRRELGIMPKACVGLGFRLAKDHDELVYGLLFSLAKDHYELQKSKQKKHRKEHRTSSLKG